MDPSDALLVWDMLIEKGKPYGITPTGLQALDISRIEAGLILLDVDYISSRHALIESRKSSPFELGLGWAVKMKKDDFIGKRALEKELKNGPEWEFVGIEIEWAQLEKHYRRLALRQVFLLLPGEQVRRCYSGSEQVGYATSGAWSPILKRYIALAHIKNGYSKEGTVLDFELKVEHFRKLTPAKVVKTPFFDPERKRSCPA